MSSPLYPGCSSLLPGEDITHPALILVQDQVFGAFYLGCNKEVHLLQVQNQNKSGPSTEQGRNNTEVNMHILKAFTRWLTTHISLEGCLSLSLPPGLDLPSQAGAEILLDMSRPRRV